MTLANRITCFRICMIPAFVSLIFEYTPERAWLRQAALGVYLLAAISDGLDGYIARRFNQRTALGARLDPLADKLLINLGLVFVAANPNFTPAIPMWFPVLILARDVLIVLGALLIRERYGNLKVKPLWTGKLTTALQLCTLIGVLIPVPRADLLVWATVAVTILSAVHYIAYGIHEAGRRKAECHG